ncbi:MAG: HAD-IA family hydrolase [Rhodobiaceae bacterium]|nr:HAD-IA family hydrolase [Rhodobiaceae bacterium]MCC0041753.1 HAD-IA family hydrolase [Rhodobiaceae bacterium]
MSGSPNEPLLVIFDMDGTLVDSQHMIVAALETAFGSEGIAPPDRRTMLSIVGLSLIEAMQTLVSDADGAVHVRLAEAYKAAFQDLRRHPEHREPLYPGALEALGELSARDEVLLGIATGKSRRGVDIVLGLHGLERHFVTIQTADRHPSKPHPSMVRKALSETGIAANRAVVVGDTVFDMEMARAAGAHALGVSWGYHDVKHLAQAGSARTLDRFAEVVPAIDQLFARGGRATE